MIQEAPSLRRGFFLSRLAVSPIDFAALLLFHCIIAVTAKNLCVCSPFSQHRAS
ncbi:hypothetical protein D083_3360 [Dickeya solani RNS 08.23.3.1.A]|nr:hypothetical protein D083_3360 [Dickeya solani RNS 08.23.3.1.A]